MPSLSLSVSEFSIPSPRSGSLETHSGYGGLPSVGTQLHIDIQARRVQAMPGYVPEKWTSHTFVVEKSRVTVSGRMDGFLFGHPPFIEEIKTAYDLDALSAALDRQPHHPYKLQLRTYGYLHFARTGSIPNLNLHLVNARNGEGVDRAIELDIPDYESWLASRLRELELDCRQFRALAKRRRRSAENFVFPFPEPRPGQRELMDGIASAFLNETGSERLMIQAPTGLGKTAGVLFPVLREAMSRGQKVLYLTPKNSQHAVAEDAAKRLQKAGVRMRSLTVHAKAKMCLKDEPHCDPQYCEYADRHYDKLSAHDLPQLMAKRKRLTATAFKKIARAHVVCPFELQMEAAARADLVICDYNYVFSPRNSVGRLTFNGWNDTRSKPNLIIDEMHNLPARATEYHSAVLSAEELSSLAQRSPENVKPQFQELIQSFCSLARALHGDLPDLAKQIEPRPESFLGIRREAQDLLARHLAFGNPLQHNDPVVRASHLVNEFTSSLETVAENFIVTLTPTSAGGSLRVVCCDASPFLAHTLERFAHVVGFSATLKPFEYYARLSGFPAETRFSEFSSPFPRHRRKILLIPQISTRWRDRERNILKIKDVVERIVQVKPGNYFVFFPSFEFLERTFRQVEVPGFRMLCQPRAMDRAGVRRFLDLLGEGIPTLVFAVQGGSLSEGVDYPGDLAIGAVIVGPGLPAFDFERERLREYYERFHGPGQGFDYAYTFPAMARSVQSAGRVIRSATDRGLIVLLDNRFGQESFRKAMPDDWEQPEVSRQILSDVRRFWEESES